MTQSDSQQVDQAPVEVQALLHLIGCGAMSQAVAVTAELGIADQLASEPKRVEQLALAAGCHAPSLLRLMRALVTLGACAERADGLYELTAMGRLLRSDSDESLRAVTIWWGRYRWPAWGQLLHSVMTGESAVGVGAATVGMKQLNDAPEAAPIFNKAMAELTRFVARGVLCAYDFSGTERIVDVGGGHGELIGSILKAYPAMRGVLFDQVHAKEGAREHLVRAGVIDRCDIVTGDFFESVPGGADVYLLKTVIHDWNDESSTVILRNCRRAMAEHGKLLLIEQIMPRRATASGPHRPVVADLNMLVMLGGRERTVKDFDELLEEAGFKMTKTIVATLDYNIIEAVAA